MFSGSESYGRVQRVLRTSPSGPQPGGVDRSLRSDRRCGDRRLRSGPASRSRVQPDGVFDSCHDGGELYDLTLTFYTQQLTVVSVSTSVSTFSSTETVLLFPQNEVVTEEIIQVMVEFYPVVNAANCGIVGGGSISLSTGSLTSYVATTTASVGTTTTVTIPDYTVTTAATITENSLAVTHTITNSTTTYTSIHCRVILGRRAIVLS